MATVVLPGDALAPEQLPTTGKSQTLRLGPGLRHVPPSAFLPTVAGALVTDTRKKAAAVESNSGRYQPYAGDLVIATVHASVADSFTCRLTPHTPPATLPHLAFEGATRKTRPQLPAASLVYCRVVRAARDAAPELTCVDPATAKGDGLGLLKGGMLFAVSLAMARRLLAPRGGLVLLDTLGEHLGFQVTVGRNGLVHVDAGSVKHTLAIGKAMQTVDEQALGDTAQKKLAADILKRT